MYLEHQPQPESQSRSPLGNASGSQPRGGGLRRWAVAALAFLSVVGGAIGGAGTTLAVTQWTADDSPYVQGTDVQPMNTTSQSVLTQDTTSLTVATAAYQEVGPSVVQVITTGQSRGRFTPQGSGSGVVVDEQGLILTNYHVVADARSIAVVFSTGEERQAEVLGTDNRNDLALLQVDLPAGVPAAVLGDSDQVQVGESVIAIGSPFGLSQTVTQGIVSAVDRDRQQTNRAMYSDLIQTDAPINPGNSGGPLVNSDGEVIGINNMIESPIEGSVGIGFAIPINMAKSLLPQLESGAQLQPAWLGISGMDLTADIADEQGLVVEEGVLIGTVVSNSPAARSGLRSEDVVTALDGDAIDSMAQMSERLREHQPGDVVSLTILRGGQSLETQVTLGTWPDA